MELENQAFDHPLAEEAIPSQKTGAEVDIAETLELANEKEALRLFPTVKNRLLEINSWQELCGGASAHFQLTDRRGKPKTGKPEEGDHIRIGLPAPGSPAGEGYDWVCIEWMEDQTDPNTEIDCVALRVRPTDNPLSDKEDVAHFYTDEATSTFMVTRHGKQVRASVHGRNEIPNVQQTDSLLDKARNALVAVPAIAGVAKIQWSSLAKGLLEGPPENT